jgi:transposase
MSVACYAYGMVSNDARSLSPDAQEALRRRVVQAVRGGLSQTEAARVFQVARPTVNRWVRVCTTESLRALRAKPRGRPVGTQVAAADAARVVRVILGRCPDQLRLPFTLWTREAVQRLLQRNFGVEVSVWTVGRYLTAWGLTPQKPLTRAYEQNPVAVRRWLDDEYPAVRAEALAIGAEIHWGDEMGFRSDYHAGRSYGRRGQTPVVPATGQRFRANVISSLTNRGRLAFMVFREGFTTTVFLRFLRRLIRLVRRPVFLVVDSHPVHRARGVTRWVTRHAGEIRLIFLPGYSPDLNPDEFLNHDVKANAVGRQRPEHQAELIANVRSYLRITQHHPAVVRRFFDAPSVRYAAA